MHQNHHQRDKGNCLLSAPVHSRFVLNPARMSLSLCEGISSDFLQIFERTLAEEFEYAQLKRTAVKLIFDAVENKSTKLSPRPSSLSITSAHFDTSFVAGTRFSVIIPLLAGSQLLPMIFYKLPRRTQSTSEIMTLIKRVGLRRDDSRQVFSLVHYPCLERDQPVSRA